MDLASLASADALKDFGKVIAIDLMMAGDNVVVLGALAAGLPAEQRRKVLTIGVGVALAFLIGFALLATQMLKIIGLLLAGVMATWSYCVTTVGQGPAVARSTRTSRLAPPGKVPAGMVV